MKIAKDISLYLVVGIVANLLAVGLESDYLSKFIDTNLIIIVAAFLAINATTTSIIVTKLKEIRDKHNLSLTGTIGELHKSLREQVVLLVVGLVFLVLKGSAVLQSTWVHYKLACDVILTATFCMAIYNTYDTAKAIFLIMQGENNLRQIPSSPSDSTLRSTTRQQERA